MKRKSARSLQLRKKLSSEPALALLDQALVSLANFVTMLLAAKLLSIDSFAMYSLAGLATLFVASLHRAYITQPLNLLGAAEAPARQLTRYQLLRRLEGWGVFPVVAVVTGLGVFFFNRPLLIAAAAAFTLSFLRQETVRRMFFTRRALRTVVALDLIAYGGQLLSLLLAWHFDLKHEALLLSAMATAFLASSLFGNCILHKGAETAVSATSTLKPIAQEHWLSSKWIVYSQFVYWGSSQIYPFQIASYVSASAVASFAISNSILNALNVLRQMLASYLPARAAEAFAKDGREGLWRFLKLTLSYCGAASIAALFFLATFSESIISAMYPNKYMDAAKIIPYMALAHIFILINVVVNVASMILKASVGIFWANLVGTIFSIFFGPVLLQKYGIWGAVAGMTIGAGLPLVVQIVHLWLHVKKSQPHHLP